MDAAVAFKAEGDPCDGCGSPGEVRIVLGSGGVLVFCGLCWEKHEAVLRPLASTVRG